MTQIRSFLAVVRYGGFTAAARALKMSQTTITSQIQALEEEHEVRLFERRGRQVDLTAVGQDFLPFANRMADIEDEATMLLRDSGELRRGALRIGAVSPYHVVAMIEAFNARFPDIYLSMSLGNSERVLADLEAYACEVGVIARGSDDDRFYMQHYASYPVVAFVRTDHRWAGREQVELAELARERLLMREAGSTTRLALEKGCAAIGVKPRTAMEIGSREAIREGVIRGLGVGTVSKSEYVPDDQLHPLEIVGSPVSTDIYICCLRERRRSRAIAAFFDIVLRPEAGASRAQLVG